MHRQYTAIVEPCEGACLHNLPRVEEKIRVLVLSLQDLAVGTGLQTADRLAGIRLELGGLRARSLSACSEVIGTFAADNHADALHYLCEAWGLDAVCVRGLLRLHSQDERVPLDFAGLCMLVRQSLESRPVESCQLASPAALDDWRSTLPKWGARTAHLAQEEEALPPQEALLSWDTTCAPAQYLVVSLAEEFVTVRQATRQAQEVSRAR